MQSRFLALVSNGDELRKNIENAENAEDVGTLQAIEALDSLESKINQVQVSYQQFYTSIGAENVWKGALDGIRNFVDRLNDLPKLFNKFPIGALAVIIDTIGLIKGALMQSFSVVGQTIFKAMANVRDQAQKGGEEYRSVGETAANALTEGFKSRSQAYKQAVAETINIHDSSLKNAQYGGNMVNFANSIDKQYANILANQQIGGNTTTFSAQGTAQITSMIQLMSNFGFITDEVRLKLMDLYTNRGGGSQEFQQELHNTTQAIREQGDEIIRTAEKTNKANGLWKNYAKQTSTLGTDLMTIGSALRLFSSLMDTTTKSGKTLSGSLTVLASTITLVGSAAKAAHEMAQGASLLNAVPWMAVAMGIIGIINGIATAYENAEERQERLAKEAEELSNKAKQAKSDYNILKDSREELEKLEEQRYDSAEAAEEYQTAVDKLADTYPQLITGLDEAGNATIEAANLDFELEKARRASAQATLTAINAEIEAKKDSLNTAKENSVNVKKRLSNYTSDQADYNTIENLITEEETYKNLIGSENIAPAWKQTDIQDFTTALLSNLEEVFELNFKAVEQYDESINSMVSDYTKDYGFKAIFDENQRWNFQITNADLFKTQLGNTELSPYTELITYFAKIDENLDNKVKNLFAILENEETTGEAFNNAIEELIELGQTNPQLLGVYQDRYDLIKQYNESEMEAADLQSQLNALDKQAVSSKIQLQKPELFEQLGDLQVIFANYLSSFNDADFNSQLSTLEQDWSNLGYYLQQQFQEKWKKRTQYTAQELIESLGIDEEDPIAKAIQKYYKDNKIDGEWYVSQLQQQMDTKFDKNDNELFASSNEGSLGSALDNLYVQISLVQGKITAEFSSWITQMINLIQDYQKKGLTANAAGVANNVSLVLATLNNLEEEDLITARNIISSNDLQTVSGVQATIKALEDAGIDGGLISSLQVLEQSLVYNLPLAITAYTDSIVSELEEVEKNIKKISSGMNVSEAVKALDLINKDLEEGQEKYTLRDLQSKKGKLYFKDNDPNDLREKYISAVIEDLNTQELEAIETRIDAIGTLELPNNIENVDDLVKAADEGIINIADGYSELFPILESLGVATGIVGKDGEIDQFKLDEEALRALGDGKLREVLMNTLNKQLDNARETIEYAQNYLVAQESLAASNYIDYIASLKGLSEQERDNNFYDLYELQREIASGRITDNIVGMTYDDIKVMKEQINSAWKAFIDDSLEKGMSTLHFEDYDFGTTMDAQTFKTIQEKWSGDITGYLLQNTEYVIDMMGLTLEEGNQYIADALERDNRKQLEGLDALKNITKTNEGFYGNLDDIQKLADALGISITNLLGEYSAELEAWTLKPEGVQYALSQIDGAAELLGDSLRSFIEELAESIGDAVEGITQSGKDNLIAKLEQFGLNSDFIDSLTFDQTVNGLKLSTESAQRLVIEMSKIDGIAGRLTFDKLYESITKAGSGLETITATSGRIAELQREISANEAEIAKANAKGDTARVEQYKNENKALKDQLSLLSQIQQRQSADPDSYSFMDNKLPEGLQGPQNYWNSVGKAFGAMREAGKTGYMEIQDFYNIVNEMNNIAAISGNTLSFMGHSLSGKAEDAASMIEWGLGALSNIDGKGVKIDFSKLGADVLAGASSMGEGFDDAIHEMAKSQIDMLDAMIQLLETVVAMEQLGDIDVDKNGTLDFGEMFNVSNLIKDYDEQGNLLAVEKLYKANQQTQQVAGTILEQAKTDEDLQKALNSVKMGDKTINDMLVDLNSGTELTEQQAQQYQAAFDSLYKMWQSGDYDLNNLAGSIADVAAMTGFTGEITVGDGLKYYVDFGEVVTIDKNGLWQDEDGNRYKTAQEAAEATALKHKVPQGVQSVGKDGVQSTVTYSENAVFTYKFNDDKELKVYSSDGTEYDSIQDAAEGEFLKQKGYESLEGNEEEFQTYLKQTGITWEPEIKTDEKVLKTASVEATKKVQNALGEAFQKGTPESFTALQEAAGEVGIEIQLDETGNMSYQDLLQVADVLGVDFKPLIANIIANVDGEGKEILNYLISQDTSIPDIEINANIHTNVDGPGAALVTDGTPTVSGTTPKKKTKIPDKLYGDAGAERVGDARLTKGVNQHDRDVANAEQLQKALAQAKVLNSSDFVKELTKDDIFIPEGSTDKNNINLKDILMNRMSGPMQKIFGGLSPELGNLVAFSFLNKDSSLTDGLNARISEILRNNPEAWQLAGNLFTGMPTTAGYKNNPTGAPNETHLGVSKEGLDVITRLQEIMAAYPSEIPENIGNEALQLMSGLAYMNALINPNDMTIEGYQDFFNGQVLPWFNDVKVTDPIEVPAETTEVDTTNVDNTRTEQENTPIEVPVETTTPDTTSINQPTIGAINYNEGQQQRFLNENGIATEQILNMSQAYHEALRGMSEGTEGAEENYTNAITNYLSSIDGLAQEVNAGLEEGQIDESSAQSMLAALEGIKTSILTDVTEMGMAVPEGLAAGMADSTLVGSSAEALAAAIPEGLDRIILVNSPSHMAQEFGQSITEGLALGMQDTSTVQAAATALAQAVVQAFQSILSGNWIGGLFKFNVGGLGYSNPTPRRVNPGADRVNENNGEIHEATVQEATIEGSTIEGAGIIINAEGAQITGTIQSNKEGGDKASTTPTPQIQAVVSSSGSSGTKPTSTQTDSPALDTSGVMSAIAIIQAGLSALGGQMATLGTSLARVRTAGATAASQMSTLASNISRLKSKSLKISATIAGTIKAKITATISATGGITSTSEINKELNTQTGSAKGNVALAKGIAAAKGVKSTLMGELGPELVVANGRYYTVGNNGAEFVDLPKDAIVFNHQQTARLLKNKKVNGRGNAVNGDKAAISFAKGTEGPAMASAAAALSQLRQIRAMWQALLNASAKDMGSKGGGSGGGGGGGGGGGEIDPGFIHDLNIWYNLLQQIDKLEKDISYQEALQAKIQSDKNGSGRALYQSYAEQSKLLSEQLAKHQELAALQEDLYKKHAENFMEGPGSLIYTFTQDGLIQFSNSLEDFVNQAKGLTKVSDGVFKFSTTYNAYERDESGELVRDNKGNAKSAGTKTTSLTIDLNNEAAGLDLISYLQQTLKNGKAKYTAEEQVAILTGIAPKFAEWMEIDSSGKDIDKAGEQMQAFWDKLDGARDEAQELIDSYREQQQKVLEVEQKLNELYKTLQDNQIEVENAILNAIEERQQKEIDLLEDEKDALEKATESFIDGLNEQLEREQQMYQDQQSDQELTRMQRQLAILQRSGGSASQIRSLQDQITSKQQDRYFNAQKEQIDAVQQASDKQIERLDNQIELMKETLEYQKENGLFWPEVTEIMQHSPEYIIDFIQTYTPDYRSNSEEQIAQDLSEIKQKVETYVEEREQGDEGVRAKMDKGGSAEVSWMADKEAKTGMSYSEEAWKNVGEKAHQAYLKTYNNEGQDTNKAWAAAAKILQAEDERLGNIKKKEENDNDTNSEKTYSSIAKKPEHDISYGYTDIDKKGKGSGSEKGIAATTKDTVNVKAAYLDKNGSVKYWGIERNGKQGWLKKGMLKLTADEIAKLKQYKIGTAIGSSFKTGGLVNFTGPAWLDGTRTKPEAVLNAEQTKFFREDFWQQVEATRNELKRFMAQSATIKSQANAVDNNPTIIIENANVNMNVEQMANDYDARTAANTVMNEMVRIARRSGNRSLSRR